MVFWFFSQYVFIKQVNTGSDSKLDQIINISKFYLFNIDWFKRIREQTTWKTLLSFKECIEEILLDK